MLKAMDEVTITLLVPENQVVPILKVGVLKSFLFEVGVFVARFNVFLSEFLQSYRSTTGLKVTHVSFIDKMNLASYTLKALVTNSNFSTKPSKWALNLKKFL